MRTMSYLLALAFAVPGASLAGCTPAGSVYVEPSIGAPLPTLVYLEPGLWVVADSNDPLFYSDGYYWLYDAGLWYRSVSYRSGFARVHMRAVPREVLSVDRPRRYAHYRPPMNARVRTGPPPSESWIRDHRTASRTRDHRAMSRTQNYRPRSRTQNYRPRSRTRDHRAMSRMQVYRPRSRTSVHHRR